MRCSMINRSMCVALAALALAPAAQARDLSGEVAYRERIALPPDALLVVELRGPGGIVAETRIETQGRQVPLPFALEAPDNGAVRVRGAIFVGGRPEWVTDAVTVPAGDGPVDLGLLPLMRNVAMGFSTQMDCGGTAVEIGFIGEGARLRSGGESFDLTSANSASGARYSDGASPETAFWSKGNTALVTLKGVDLPECMPMVADSLLPLRARGNEPGWTLDVTRTGFVYLGDMGERRVEGALPAGVPEGNAVRFVVSPDLAFTVERALCRDDMSGMPFPVSVTVSDGERQLRGCGGEPADLLEGGWRVETVADAPMPAGAEASLDFDVASGRVSGKGGCNRYTGGFTLTGEGLSFGPAASTMMACPEDLMSLEQAFHKALKAVDRFDFATDGALELLAGDAVVIRARR